MSDSSVHVARVGLFTIDPNGNRVDKNSSATTINQLKNIKQEFLIIPDIANAPNSSGYPTITSYLETEAAADYEIQYLDQSYCLTMHLAAGLTGATGPIGSAGATGVVGATAALPVSTSPISYSYTGVLALPPQVALSSPTPGQFDGVVDDYSGKWVQFLNLSSINTALTSITFDDIIGVPAISLSGFGALTSINFPSLTSCWSSISVSNMPALVSFSAPVLKIVNSISFASMNNTGFTSISFPKLTTVLSTLFGLGAPYVQSYNLPMLTTVGSNLSPTSWASLTSFYLPVLATVGGTFSPSNMNALTSLNLPALTTVGVSFSPNTMASLTSLSIPVLAIVGNTFGPNSMAALTSLSAPALTTIAGGSFTPTTMASLTSMSFPALTSVYGIFAPATMASLTSITISSMVRIGTGVISGSIISIISGTAALTTFQLPSTLLQIGNGAGNVVITSAALNQASVDNILVRLAALDGTGGTTAFSSRVVTITGTSSTPSATGLAAKATLVARGCTVTNN